MITDRKYEHLKICKNSDVEYHKTTGFEDIEFIPTSFPEVNFNKIDTSIDFFGKKLELPLIISGITGGHPKAKSVNANLAKVAEKTRIAMGVGSQRAGVTNPELTNTYEIVREEAPTTSIIGNIGVPQIEYAKESIDMIDADLLAVHLNPLQEIIQPEGDVNAIGYIQDMKEICESINVPIIAKETGAGISQNDAKMLENLGVDAIDIQGSGGTSWAAVESYRDQDQKIGELFWDWGIKTAVSTITATNTINIPIISSGGIRNGLEAAKALAFGASCVGIALPLFRIACDGEKAVENYIENFKKELKTAMFLVGASTIEELHEKKLIITGKTREILNELEIDTKQYTRRQ